VNSPLQIIALGLIRGEAFFRLRPRQALRVAGLMKTQKYLGGNQNSVDEMIEGVIEVVLKEWGRL
jgi:hypothetical protein